MQFNNIMWKKLDSILLWVPTNFVFRESLAFFTLAGILDDTKQIKNYGLDILRDKATIVVYENITADREDGGINPDLHPLVALFKTHILGELPLAAAQDALAQESNTVAAEAIPIIGIFAFKRNRYSKPFTGAYELLHEEASTCERAAGRLLADVHFVFRPQWSIMVSDHIGISGRYVDRAFAQNIGISTIVTPAIYFKASQAKIEWNWPHHVMTPAQKKKLFVYTGEPKFADFLFPGHVNVVAITGPPCSGKTVLAKRVAQYINGTICKEEMPGVLGKSLVYVGRAASAQDKQRVVEWLSARNTHGEAPNIVWLEMEVPRVVAEFLRNLRVQISARSCPELLPYAEFKSYYRDLDSLSEAQVPSFITHMRFPLILKKIKELDYVF
jgi:hypothetical protein